MSTRTRWQPHVALAGIAALSAPVALPAGAPFQATTVAHAGPVPEAPTDGAVWPLPNVRARLDGFLGGWDERALDQLTQGHIVRIKKGSGGRSLGFKLYFESGAKGYFKPAQTFSGAIWFAEVAAYHLDRMLEMGRVPPVISYRMRWADLKAAAGKDRRRGELEIGQDGTLVGALVYWLPEAMSRTRTPPGWENWIRVERLSPYAVTPYQRPATYTKALARRTRVLADNGHARRYYDEPPNVPEGELAAALSDMLVLDFLTLNIDRWGGDNANVLSYGDEQPSLIFLDNGAGFSPGPDRRGLMDDRLEVQQCFRKSTIAALRALQIDDLSQRLAGEAVTPVLSADLLAGLEVRRTALLNYVDELIEEHGADAVLAWP